MQRFFRLFAAIIFLPVISYCQNYERISFDDNDSTDGYYLAIRPQSNTIKGVVVLLSSFIPPEGLLPETKLHNTASANDLLTVVASTKQKLYADSAAIHRINFLLKDVVTRFAADTSKFALAGFDEAGAIALRYTEYTYENPVAFPVQPKAVFAIDAPVDLVGLWHWSERQIKKNFWPGAVGDARYYLDAMTKELGTVYNHPEVYNRLSPFIKNRDTTGNEQYLKHVAVRLYYDTDIEWQLKNRRNSFYDTKLPDGSEFINRLLLLGNTKAEFVPAKQPGVRSNGVRHPTSLSIVDEPDCIQWIKRSLLIFDAANWTPPYRLAIPKGWNTEHFALPPDFAPQLTYKGVEDLRFAPGWGDSSSLSYWSYAYMWWLDGMAATNAAALQETLTAYYSGLVGRNIKSRQIPDDKIVPTQVRVKKIKTATGDKETYSGSIRMLDYMALRPVVLHLAIHVKDCNAQGHTAIFFEVSPKPVSDGIWQQLDSIGSTFQCSN